MEQITFMPKLFYAQNTSGNLYKIVATIVDDIIITVVPDYVENFL